jgi:hypothetical protein
MTELARTVVKKSKLMLHREMNPHGLMYFLNRRVLEIK